jgi:hypothetical protein
MEVDWEYEIGLDAPVIDAAWSGFIDLRLEPQRVRELAETAQFPALGAALVRLNGAGSPVWTSKCDVWPLLDPAEWDADELNAPPERATHAMGCYIDLLPADGLHWNTPEIAEDVSRLFCAKLKSLPLRYSRADLVIRHAIVAPGRLDFGITAYLTACGASTDEATLALGSALGAFADAILAA